ncbi:MAG TPA: hypothetical protein VLG50_05895 [Candidatus Saccharimonadales bacterium]|nr:hypothetical protein [Candidatus Saccharimonadales bacterium]
MNDDILSEIILNTSHKDLHALCQTNHHVHQVCQQTKYRLIQRDMTLLSHGINMYIPLRFNSIRFIIEYLNLKRNTNYGDIYGENEVQDNLVIKYLNIFLNYYGQYILIITFHKSALVAYQFETKNQIILFLGYLYSLIL